LLTLTLVSTLALAGCFPAGDLATPTTSGLVIPTLPGQAATQSLATPVPTQAVGLQWPEPPAMQIDPTHIYLATSKTAKGDIVVELLADKAPITVNNFIFLAREGFYDDTTFHRVLDDFMAQGGDPTGTGTGGPGYRFQDEFHPDLRFDEPGLLAMANSGPGTNGSQFFITFVPTPHLTGRHTIFGKVVEGLEVAQALTRRDPEANPDFSGDSLQTIEIEELTASLLPPPTATPVPIVPEPDDSRPLAELDIAARENLYTGAPAMIIDPAGHYVAVLTTTQGDIEIELHPADAPLGVNNFVVLAELGYWDGFPISYAEPGNFVLTGSPQGLPTSDIGYILPPETARTHVAGSLGYWYRDDLLGSSGSQIYIVFGPNANMDGRFSTFGTITTGLDIAAGLTVSDTIETITISERP
jgi:cyclophilin family peptidyl-prolyl cis-trans isomerase